MSRITETFIKTLNSHAPLRPLSRRERKLNEKSWITKGILKSIKTKNKLFKSCYKCSEANKIELYKKYRNKLTHVKSFAKSQYYNKLLTENLSNPKKTWEVLGQIIEGRSKSRNKLPTSLKINGQICETDSDEFLNQMCEYFANVGSNLSKRNKSDISELKIFSKSIMQSFTLHEITESEVSLAISDVKSNSAPGIDGISPKFVKMARVVLTPILTKLYNKCLQQECFPDEFKVGQVIPIPKTSTPKELGEFRPISLLNLFSKIFEKVLKTKIMDFLDKYNILSPEQFGFTTNSSTELAITTIYDKFLDNLDKNQYTCAIFLDIKKAFDSLDHKILLKKLDHYGFRGKIWNLLKSYMENRKICTKVEQKASKYFKVTHGIPQGSVLGPLLFLLFINDLPQASKFNATLFADDANLHISHQNPHSLQVMVNEEIEKIENWMYFNKLTLNYSKCCFMIISRKPLDASKFSLSMNKVNIKRSDCIKYLGVLLDEQLSWKNHVQKLNKNLSKICGLIFKLRHYVPLITRKLIYYSMFHSVILYSLINWGRTTNSYLHQLVVLQNKFIRASLFLPRNSPTNSLYVKFQTLKLKDMIRLEFAKFIFKFKNNMLPSSFNNYFIDLNKVHKHNTRQKSIGSYYHHSFNSEFGRKRLQHICLQEWETIPLAQKECSFSRFKNNYKAVLFEHYSKNLV